MLIGFHDAIACHADVFALADAAAAYFRR